MGDFNPNTPDLRGIEPRFHRRRLERLDASTRALVQRVRPGAVTLTNDHCYLDAVVGNPGLAVEYVDVLEPAVTETDYYPGTDSGATTTGWVDQAAGAANFSEIDDAYTTSDYHTTSAALSASSTLDLLFRGAASSLSGKRIISVALWASIKVTVDSGNGDEARVKGILNLGGTSYSGGGAVDVPKTGRFSIYELSKWRLNPSTGVPWTQSEVNNLVAAGATDEFGIRVLKARLVAGGIRVSGMWLRVETVTENRFGYHYLGDPPREGWTELALSGAAAFSANTWYYRVLYPLVGNAENYFEVPVLTHATAPAPAAASGTGEHRVVSAATLGSQGGVPVAVTARPGQILPALLDTGSIISQSQPYVDLALQDFYSGATANRGQEITCAAGTAYAGLRLPVGWQDPAQRPDAPLLVELRTGGGALTGGGTLQATAVLDPASTVDGAVADRLLTFTSFTPGATQVFALIKSAATSGRGWSVPRLDTRSDRIGSGTTLNEIEQASFGPSSGTGQTDSWSSGGTEADRYDVPVALIAAPAAPAGFSAVAVAASSGVPPVVFLSWTATALGSSFGAYRVYRRPSRVVAEPWTLIAELDVPSGYTASVVEAQHVSFVDFEAGWSVTGGAWSEGWDYAVTSVSATTGLESAKSTDVRNVVAPDTEGWLVSNQAPWLNLRGTAVLEPRSGVDFAKVVRRPAGRDLAVVTTPLELPPMVLSGRWESYDRVGDFQVRNLLAAAAGGRQICIHRILGDRILGDLDVTEIRERPAGAGVSVPIEVTETARGSASPPAPANYNRACGIAFDGTADYVTTGQGTPPASLAPGAGAFTIFVAGVFPNAASKALAVNGTPGGTAGAGLVAIGSNGILFIITGASATVLAAQSSAAGMFDGSAHVLVATHDGSSTQKIYGDGVDLAATGTGAPGSLAAINSGFAFGAAETGSGGASFAALNPGLAAGWYNRALSATEVAALTNYLRASVVASARPPAGAALLWDCRDDRCWSGFGDRLEDLSGNGNTGTIVSSPPTRGIPWPLRELQRF